MAAFLTSDIKFSIHQYLKVSQEFKFSIKNRSFHLQINCNLLLLPEKPSQKNLIEINNYSKILTKKKYSDISINKEGG